MIDGPNEYTYVNQNPWTSFDPEGLAGDDRKDWTWWERDIGAVLDAVLPADTESSKPISQQAAYTQQGVGGDIARSALSGLNSAAETVHPWASTHEQGLQIAENADMAGLQFLTTASVGVGLGAEAKGIAAGFADSSAPKIVDTATEINAGNKIASDSTIPGVDSQATTTVESKLQQIQSLQVNQPEGELAQAEANIGNVPAKKTVAANAEGDRTLSGWTDTPGFLPSSDQTAAVLQKADDIGYTFKGAGAFDQGVPGAYNASHAEPQLSLQSSTFAVSKDMCTSCRSFMSYRAMNEGTTFTVQDPTNVWTFTQDFSSWQPR